MSPTTTASSPAFEALRAWVDRGATLSESMPADWYTAPEVFELERNHLFAKTWHIVGHADDVSEPGDYFTMKLLGEPLIIVRNKQGVVNALSNVCRHRAGPVARGCGNRKGFTCAYHGWAYDLDGQGRGCGGMEDAEDFEPRELQLPKYRAEVWGRWVFVTMSDDAPPFDEWIETVADRAENYQLDDLEYLGARKWELPVNWKVMNDANHEAYHVPFVHPGLQSAYNVSKNFGTVDGDTLAGRTNGASANGDASEADGYTHMTKPYGGEIFALEPNPRGPFSKVIGSLGGTADYRQIKPPLSSLEGRERLAHYFLFNWPGLSHFHFMPDGLGLILLIPIAHDRTEVRVEWWMPRVEAFDEKLLQAALIVFGNQILDEDVAMNGMVWRGLQSEHYDRGRMAPTMEGLLYAYDAWYIEQMQAALAAEEA